MGLTHLDAGVIIGLLDGDDSHHSAARAALSTAIGKGDNLSIAASALAECLVAPARSGQAAIELVRTAIRRLPAEIVDLNPEIAVEAAVIRARHRSLKLPDALVIASASVAGADRLITTDRKWPSAQVMGLAVEIEAI